MDLRKEIERLLRKYPDPRLGVRGRLDFEAKHPAHGYPGRYAVVSDNRDPAGLGRLRATGGHLPPGTVTGWLPVVRPKCSVLNR